MNKICKRYISDVKKLFPLKGKEEKKYIKKLQITIEEFCEEDNIESKEQLYSEFGDPSTVVTDYFDTLEIEKFIKKIKISKYIKIALVIIISALIVFSSIYNQISYYKLQDLLASEVVYIEEKLVIEKGK